MPKNILLIVALSCFMPLAQAHDAGISRTNIQLQAGSLAMQTVFSRQDLERLVVLDGNHDGTVSVGEFTLGRNDLEAVFREAMEVRQGGQRYWPMAVDLRQVDGDTIAADIQYGALETTELQVGIPLLTALPRGHRQYVTVRDEAGNLFAQYLYKADSPPMAMHVIAVDFFAVFSQYLQEGVWHIWIGFDHILFLLTLLLPAVLVYHKPNWQSQQSMLAARREVLKVVTAFTVAHSITLALAVLELLTLPPRPVEAIIAFSVLITAVNNLKPIFSSSRWLLAFVFGLLHGFGFAAVLADLGLPGEALLTSLLGFNLGVEIGQLAIVAIVFPLAAWLRYTRFYRTWVLKGGSSVAAVIAMVWMVERL